MRLKGKKKFLTGFLGSGMLLGSGTAMAINGVDAGAITAVLALPTQFLTAVVLGQAWSDRKDAEVAGRPHDE